MATGSDFQTGVLQPQRYVSCESGFLMWKKKMRTLSTGDQPNSQAEPGKAEPAATTMVKQTLDTPRTNPAPPAAPIAAPPKPDSPSKTKAAEKELKAAMPGWFGFGRVDLPKLQSAIERAKVVGVAAKRVEAAERTLWAAASAAFFRKVGGTLEATLSTQSLGYGSRGLKASNMIVIAHVLRVSEVLAHLE